MLCHLVFLQPAQVQTLLSEPEDHSTEEVSAIRLLPRVKVMIDSWEHMMRVRRQFHRTAQDFICHDNNLFGVSIN